MGTVRQSAFNFQEADRGHATCSCNSHSVHTRLGRLEAERPGRQVRTQAMSVASHVHPKRPASGPALPLAVVLLLVRATISLSLSRVTLLSKWLESPS